MNFVITRTETYHFAAETFEKARKHAHSLRDYEDFETIEELLTCEDTGEEQSIL